jgi:hypothetical protein
VPAGAAVCHVGAAPQPHAGVLLRRVLPLVLAGTVLFGAARPALALDYVEPVIPPAVRVGGGEAPPGELDADSTTLPITGLATTPPEPVPDMRAGMYVPQNAWEGCAHP